MRYYIFLLLSLLIASSCHRKEKAFTGSNGKEKLALTDELKIDNSTKLDYVLLVGKTGYGGGAFTYDSIKIENRKFIFLSSLDEDLAIVKINGKEISLIQDSANCITRKGNYIQEAWIGSGISVVLKVNVVNETGDEVNAKGTMELRSKNSFIQFKIHGGWEG